MQTTTIQPSHLNNNHITTSTSIKYNTNININTNILSRFGVVVIQINNIVDLVIMLLENNMKSKGYIGRIHMIIMYMAGKMG
jgi:hypothetical protein